MENRQTLPLLVTHHQSDGAFTFLDEKNIRKKILDLDLPQFARTQFYIPSIHCPSCMEVLEGLNKKNPGIIKSEVNFIKKIITLDFNPRKIKLSDIASLLTAAGYKPTISLDSETKLKKKKHTNDTIIKLAVAGFCFGNIMLLSFPEYLGIEKSETYLQALFSHLNIALSLPVLLYSARGYFTTTWKGLLQKKISIDTPITIGLVALFLRSLHDILLQGNPGYLDSLAGLVFFLLIGKWFQSKTYEGLAFDRDYRAYFPLAIYKKVRNSWKPTVIYELQPGNCIRVRNQEIVPADSCLLDKHAYIDYSFVTGESTPKSTKKGDLIYAGGRLVGLPVTMQVQKKTSQSHLIGLWNNDLFAKPENGHYKTLINKVAKEFTWIVLTLALGTTLYWYFVDASKIWLTVTAVLIVACPCALALAAPFTYGSTLRFLGRYGFYLKNAEVVEKMARTDSIIFDKTGTITQAAADVYQMGELSVSELSMIKKLASSSTHPLSVLMAKSITAPSSAHHLTSYKEWPGKGLTGVIDTTTIKLGSAPFVGAEKTTQSTHSQVYISIDGKVRGHFIIRSSLRRGIEKLIAKLGERVTALLSGDGEGDRSRMESIFSSQTKLCFNQTPHDKLNYISKLQQEGKKVMMIGDGLNDSGALKRSNVGIALTDSTGIFTPACDAMLDGDKLILLNRFLSLSKASLSILKISLLISLLYNALGIVFAMAGYLTPLAAAILMPVSSISVVIFTTLAVKVKAKKIIP